MTAGRNDSCPCGSGRKYKHCCLAATDAREIARLRLRSVEAVAVEVVLAHALKRFGRELLDEAWGDFFQWTKVPEEPGDHPFFDTIFLLWMLTDWTPADGGDDVRRAWPPTPLLRDYLDSGGPGIDPFQAEVCREMCRRPFSFHAVTGAAPGVSLDLEDVMTGATHTVLEREASGTMARGCLLFTKVVGSGGDSIMMGAAPVFFPPGERSRLMDLRRHLAGRSRRLRMDELDAHAEELRTAFLVLAKQSLEPRIPELRNTDGDPLELTTLYFDLSCTPREAFDALQGLAFDETAEELLEQAGFGSAGALRSATFAWKTAGNRLHKEWENTVLGTISIDEARLKVEVNSRRRADQIRREIEGRIAGRVTFRRARRKSAGKLLEGAASRRESSSGSWRQKEQEAFQRQPGIQAMMRDLAAKHWEAWLDERIPALAGQTPRQAARSAAGRERLEALLAEYAWRDEGLGENPFRADVPALRRRLGL